MPKDCKWIEFKTLEEYAEFFEAIPEEKWCTGKYKIDDCMCSLGHLTEGEGDLNAFMFENEHPFRQLFDHNSIPSISVTHVNDGHFKKYIDKGILNKFDTMDLGDTPKERILNALTLKIAGLWGVACGIQE